MELLHVDAGPPESESATCRSSHVPPCIFFAVVLTITLLLAGAVVVKDGSWGWWILVAFLALFSRLAFHMVRSSFSESNWVVRIVPDAIYVKFRSHMNAHLSPEDDTVVRIALDEIHSVRRHEEKRSNGEGHQRVRFLELRLVHEDTDALRLAVEREQMLKPKGIKVHHYPVEVPRPGCIRVVWRGQSSSVVPGLEHTLEVLGMRLPLGDVEVAEHSGAAA